MCYKHPTERRLRITVARTVTHCGDSVSCHRRMNDSNSWTGAMPLTDDAFRSASLRNR
jgi:hypothetical protein